MEDLVSFFYYASIAFSIWMGIDCIRRKDNVFLWLFAIFLFHPLGSIYYFYKVKPFQFKMPVSSPKGIGNIRIFENRNSDPDEESTLKEQVQLIDGAHQYEKLGLFYLKNGQMDQAIQSLKTSIEKAPASLDARYGLSKALYRSGRVHESINYLSGILKEDPKFDYGYALFGLAEAYRAAGEDEKAIEHYDKVYKTYSFFKANVNYGELLKKNNRREDAVMVMRSIIENSKRLPDYKYRQEQEWIVRAETFLKAVT